MKKLTPFQKKLARWCNKKLGTILYLVIIIVCSSPLMFGVFRIGAVLGECSISLWLGLLLHIAVVICAGGAVVIWFLPGFWMHEITLRLPETWVEKAEEMKKVYPKYEKRIDELIQKAFVQDDGGELKEVLEKFKILASKEESLADLPNQAENIKTEIAALEKELGLRGGSDG